MPRKPARKTASKKKSAHASPSIAHRPAKSSELVVTQKNLSESNAAVLSELTTLRLETRAGFLQVDARFAGVDNGFVGVEKRFVGVDARFTQIDARFAEVDARFAEVDNRFIELRSEMQAGFTRVDGQLSEVKSLMHKVLAIVEEQNAKFNFALDGYAAVDYHIDKLEKKIKDL
jgi:hypothetical protein